MTAQEMRDQLLDAIKAAKSDIRKDLAEMKESLKKLARKAAKKDKQDGEPGERVEEIVIITSDGAVWKNGKGVFYKAESDDASREKIGIAVRNENNVVLKSGMRVKAKGLLTTQKYKSANIRTIWTYDVEILGDVPQETIDTYSQQTENPF